MNKPIPEMYNLKIVFAISIGIILGVVLIAIINNQQLSDEEIYTQGYNYGVITTSQDVMYKGILPVFNVTENNTEYLGELNLTTGVIRW